MTFPYITFTITGSTFSELFFFLEVDGVCLPACGQTRLLQPAEAGGVLPPATRLFGMSSGVTNRPPAFLFRWAGSHLALLQKSVLIQHIFAAARSIPLQQRRLVSTWLTLPLLLTYSFLPIKVKILVLTLLLWPRPTTWQQSEIKTMVDSLLCHSKRSHMLVGERAHLAVSTPL